LLFSALAAINAFWQWTKEGGITNSDWDFIDALIAKANYQLMTPNIGQIIMYTTADAPLYVLPCDGETYNREDYPDLYDVLDAAYIVDADTFVTPALQSRSPIGAGTGTGLSTYAVNEITGEENHYLSSPEMPSHAHGLFQTDSLAVAPGELPVLIPFIAALGSTDSTGGGTSHNTIHPVNAVKFGVIYQ
jgi:microcystin-dependent protein